MLDLMAGATVEEPILSLGDDGTAPTMTGDGLEAPEGMNLREGSMGVVP